MLLYILPGKKLVPPTLTPHTLQAVHQSIHLIKSQVFFWNMEGWVPPLREVKSQQVEVKQRTQSPTLVSGCWELAQVCVLDHFTMVSPLHVAVRVATDMAGCPQNRPPSSAFLHSPDLFRRQCLQPLMEASYLSLFRML